MLWVPPDPILLPLALIAGIALGHAYDHWANHQSDKHLSDALTRSLGGTSAPTSATNELQFLFKAAGRISKASGRVQSAHIDKTEAVIKALQLDSQGRKRAIGWFEEGKDNQGGFSQLAKACLQSKTQDPNSRTAIVRCLCDFAVIEPTSDAVKELKRLAAMLGFASGRVGQFYGDAHSRRTIRREPPKSGTSQQQSARTPETTPEPPQEVIAAYHYLDCKPGAGQDAVKQAYRRLVSRYHPDRLPNSAKPSEIEHAKKKMVALRDALETLEAYLASS